jgi:hypothetical protein
MKAREHLDFLKSFAPDFIPSLLHGDNSLYSNPEHDALLVDGLRKVAPKD